MAGQEDQPPTKEDQPPPKRHLVRWGDDLDRKLALAIQYVCNADGIRIPWVKVGAIMGEGISDGAVVQHLAKLRQRLVSQGLSVPPPLRRGGGYAIPTSSGGNLGSSSSTLSTLSKNAKKASVTQSSSSAAVMKKKKKKSDADKTSDSGVDFEKTRSKRVKLDSDDARLNSKIKKGESDEVEKPISDRAWGKRKQQPRETGSAPSKCQEKREAKSPKLAVRACRSTAKYAGLSESDSSEEYEDSHSENAEQKIVEEDSVAAKATFLRSESAYEESQESQESEGEHNDSFVSPIPKKPTSNSSSKIVVLRIGNSERARKILEDSECMSETETDLDSDSDEEHDEMEDNFSQDVFDVNAAMMNNPQNVNEAAEHEAVGFDQPSRDGIHPFGNNFGNATAMPHAPQAVAHDLIHHTTYHPINLLNSAPTIAKGVSLYADNTPMTMVQGDSQSPPNESFNDPNFMGSSALLPPSIQGGVYDYACHNSGGQDLSPNWISETSYQSFSDLAPHNIHRYSTAEFDSAPASSSLYVPTPSGSGYHTPNNLNWSGDQNGNQHTTVSGQHANCEGSDFLHSGMARSMNPNRCSREVLNPSLGTQYQAYSVEHDLNHDPFFPATQQRMLLSSIPVQQAIGPSISNPPSLMVHTTSNYDPSHLDNMSIADFDSPQVHSAGQVPGGTQDGLRDGDEYPMMDTFDFASYDANFGHEDTFA